MYSGYFRRLHSLRRKHLNSSRGTLSYPQHRRAGEPNVHPCNLASGAKQRIGFYSALNPDCSSIGDVNVRVTKQPEHGVVETLVRTDYVRFPKENIRFKCNQLKVKGTLVNYKRRRNILAKMSLTCLFSTRGIGSETSFRHKRALNKPTTFAPLSSEMLYGAFFVGR